MRRNPKISGTTHNIFGIQTGVAIGFLVRDKSKHGKCSIHYTRREDAEVAKDKLTYLRGAELNEIVFADIAPDSKNNWLDQSNSDFDDLLTLANRKTKFAKTASEEQAMFGLVTNAVKSNRDDWVYDFDVDSLRNKAQFFADRYNEFLDTSDQSYNPIIKWSHALYDRFERGERMDYNNADYTQSLWRPFVVKNYIAETALNDRLTSNHYLMFGADLRQTNKVINVCVNGKDFYVPGVG